MALHPAAEKKPTTKLGEYLSLFAHPGVLEYLPHTHTHTVGSVLAFFPSTSKGQYMYNATQSSPVSHDPLPAKKKRKKNFVSCL